MAGTDIVTTRQTSVTFMGGPQRPLSGPHPVVVYTPPRDTLDPRYRACTDHHVACDCREAEWAEERTERVHTTRELQQAVDAVLAGHATRRSDDGTPCHCTGCQIARLAHLYPEGGFR